MRREQLIEKILDIKRNKGWSWKHITEEIGGVSPILVVGALLGQMKGALLANLRQHGDDARRRSSCSRRFQSCARPISDL
jgi:cyanate lyase